LLLGGGAAAKVAAAVAIVSATTVVAADPVLQHRSHGSQPARAVVPAHPLRTTRVQTGTSVGPAAPSAARVVPVRHAKRAKHLAASSRHKSTPALLDASTPTSKRVAREQQPVAAPPPAKGHAKPKAPVSTTEGAQVKATHPVGSKAHVTRLPQSHATAKKVGPAPKSASPAVAPLPPAAHNGDADNTKDPKG
jgi:hypothetical protein